MKKLMIFLLFTVFISCGEDSVQKNDADTEIAENELTENDYSDQDVSDTNVTDEATEPDETPDSSDEESEIPDDGCYREIYNNFVSEVTGDESCVYQGERSFRLVHFVEPANHDLSMLDNLKICAMTIDKIESGEIENYSTMNIYETPYFYTSGKQIYTDISGTAEGEKCFDADKYTVRFSGYDKSFFKNSIIGKTIYIHSSGNYNGGALIHYIAYEDNTWLVINAKASGSYEFISVNQPGFQNSIPVFSAVQKDLPSCEEICITEKYEYTEENVVEITNYTFQPPVEISIEGEEPVILRNGEVKIVNNFEYFSDFSVTVSENDPDGKFTIGYDADPAPSSNGQFYFSVLNIGALK